MSKSTISISTNAAKGIGASALGISGVLAIGDGINRIDHLTKSEDPTGVKILKGIGAGLEILIGGFAAAGAGKLAYDAATEKTHHIDLLDASQCVISGVHDPLGHNVGECINDNSTMSLVGHHGSDFVA